MGGCKMTKRWLMYSRIQAMKSEGFKQRKVAKLLKIHRSTVKKYWDMTPEEFQERILEPAKKSSLEQHKGLMLIWLRTYPKVTAAQIYDWLKDKYSLTLAENSVRRYVRMLRKEYDIKVEASTRVYEAITDPPMGLQMQIDIGIVSVENIWTRRYQRLYCIGFVLSNSRYKYGVWFSKPPEAKDMVAAIQQCFDWMGGKPKELVFDQDRLIAVDENYGDIIFTREFESFRQMEKLDIYLCRKGDPESKGKAEAVVKFFKNNFAKYRPYTELWVWEEEFESWLHRTGNAKKNSITKKIPAEVFEIECGYLTPVSYIKETFDGNIILRNVRKDNTVMYEGNRYTVPSGSFSFHEKVQLEIQGDELLIYDIFCDVLLARHKVSFEKGKLIQNNNHLRNKGIKIDKIKNTLIPKFNSQEAALDFLERIHTEKTRYARDQFLLIEKILNEYDIESVETALQYCMCNELFSAVDFRDAVIHFSQGIKKDDSTDTAAVPKGSVPDVKVAKRDLKDMIDRLKGGDDRWLN
ncbi:MAG: transposase [Tindallia sp. MSAO_Bac2]|nr:MAG: transposase [Tindallia sp. MSAO_Bac2]